jgi:hypothetical protein
VPDALTRLREEQQRDVQAKWTPSGPGLILSRWTRIAGRQTTGARAARARAVGRRVLRSRRCPRGHRNRRGCAGYLPGSDRRDRAGGGEPLQGKKSKAARGARRIVRVPSGGLRSAVAEADRALS